MVQVWNRETELRWGARCVANIFRDARSRAITHNREHWVEVDLTSQRVRTTMGDRAYRSSPPGITVVDWAPLPASVILHGNADCSLKEGKKVMQFNPDGSGNTGYVCIMAAGSPPQRRFRVGIPFAANGRIVIGR